MAWRYNPFTDTFQYYNSATEIAANFLKLDASNGPVTGQLDVQPTGETALNASKDIVVSGGRKIVLNP